MARDTNGDIGCTGCNGITEGNGVIQVAYVTTTLRAGPKTWFFPRLRPQVQRLIRQVE